MASPREGEIQSTGFSLPHLKLDTPLVDRTAAVCLRHLHKYCCPPAHWQRKSAGGLQKEKEWWLAAYALEHTPAGTYSPELMEEYAALGCAHNCNREFQTGRKV